MSNSAFDILCGMLWYCVVPALWVQQKIGVTFVSTASLCLLLFCLPESVILTCKDEPTCSLVLLS